MLWISLFSHHMSMVINELIVPSSQINQNRLIGKLVQLIENATLEVSQSCTKSELNCYNTVWLYIHSDREV